MRIIIVLIPIILICMIFAGCRTWPHSNYEAKKYVKKNISTSPFIITDTGNKDTSKYWLIYFEDKPDYTFQVISQESSLFGIPMGYILKDNFDLMFSYYYLNEFNQTHTSALYATKHYDIEGHYTKDEVRIFANDIQEYYDYIQNQPYPAKVKILCKFVGKDGNELDHVYLLLPFLELTTEVNVRNIENELIQCIEKFMKEITDFNNRLPGLNETRKGNGYLKPLPPRNENESQQEYYNKNIK